MAPAAIGFVKSEALGEAYHGDLFVGLSVPLPLGGPLFRQTESGSTHLTATLPGEAEVPGPGDPDGSGHSNVFLNQEASSICFSIVASDITLPAAAAHIHVGRRGVAGPVVVPLDPPDENGVSTGCKSDVDPDLIGDIIARPSGYYVNVHTSDFPDGANRVTCPECHFTSVVSRSPSQMTYRQRVLGYPRL